MSGIETTRMLKAYYQERLDNFFFTGFFKTTPESFHDSESVEVDVVRSGGDVAIAVTDLTAGYNANSTDLYTNKSFVPPLFQESFAVNASDLIKRTPGQNPFDDPNFQSNATARMLSGAKKIEAKIRRAIELQASQIMQTGTVSLTDADGNVRYTIDFKPKATHFPTAVIAWDTANAVIASDLIAFFKPIRNDGQGAPAVTIWGDDVFEVAMNNTAFKTRFETRRTDLGTISPIAVRGAEGGQYRGQVDLGNFKVDVWTTEGTYDDPATGAVTQYMDRKKVIAMIPGRRLDATFGGIPTLVPPEQRVLKYLPGRASGGAGNVMDMHWNAWVTPDGRQLMAGVGSRPLLIPVALDTFGCLDSNIT